MDTKWSGGTHVHTSTLTLIHKHIHTYTALTHGRNQPVRGAAITTNSRTHTCTWTYAHIYWVGGRGWRWWRRVMRRAVVTGGLRGAGDASDVWWPNLFRYSLEIWRGPNWVLHSAKTAGHNMANIVVTSCLVAAIAFRNNSCDYIRIVGPHSRLLSNSGLVGEEKDKKKKK